jgi:hypothetical protein
MRPERLLGSPRATTRIEARLLEPFALEKGPTALDQTAAAWCSPAIPLIVS